MLGMRGFVYDQPFAVPAAIVARYLGKLTAAQWRSAGLEARSLGYEENLNKSSDDGLDGLYIFLIVLASVIYLCVFVLFCYLMAVVIRYCVSGERNATMATISSAGACMPKCRVKLPSLTDPPRQSRAWLGSLQRPGRWLPRHFHTRSLQGGRGHSLWRRCLRCTLRLSIYVTAISVYKPEFSPHLADVRVRKECCRRL